MEWVESIGKVVAVVIGLFSLSVTAYQTRINTRVNQAKFWLELRRMFSEHSDVHLKLPGGAWSASNVGPSSREDWAKLEAYMGLFEHCNRMLDQKLIDWKTFERIYAYRLRHILHNNVIVRAKLIDHRDEWLEFVELVGSWVRK
jgi:hypothetical protein